MSRLRLSLLAVTFTLAICWVLTWWYNANTPGIPDEINGFPTRKPFAVQPSGKFTPPLVPDRVRRDLEAKGLKLAPAPNSEFLPPLPDNAPPVPPPPPIARLNRQGVPETQTLQAPTSLKKVP